MAETYTPLCNFGELAKDFTLTGTDDARHSLQDCRGKNGTLIMFICNHCPFVQAIQKKIVRDTRELLEHGVTSVAIMSNDPTDYPEDSFSEMKKVAKKLGYPFPYLIDDTQEVAQAYGAVATPDFFGYNAQLELQYRGRLDDSRMQHHHDHAKRELFEAMTLVAKTGQGPKEQVPSVGCSIKWIS